ncbi:MAG: anhydro-N-acetylmuramic acid kinase [Chitinophagaceae bacterium]|nr:anhydro-N-acetylmuramic acid kinase [Chitinophagaceae bacterium]
MIYRAIGIMSGSSLDGMDMAYVIFNENGGQWDFELKAAACLPYTKEWSLALQNAHQLTARDYQLLHTAYGHYIGRQVNAFIDQFQLQYQIGLIASHGHTVFHLPSKMMTAQLGDGAAIAAETLLPVVSDLRSLDIAFGGQGAPIVPIGEKWLFSDYPLLLNIGGIANMTVNTAKPIAFDICPANRVLNLLANDAGKEFDENGNMAAAGKLHQDLLNELNQQAYYAQPFPKSLANDFGTDVIYPLIQSYQLFVEDALRTYVEHICMQLAAALQKIDITKLPTGHLSMMITGGGAHHQFLVSRIQENLNDMEIQIELPGDDIIDYKEALIMAFIGVLRWRQEYNVVSFATGAGRDSIGGALWLGGDA